MGKQKFTNLKVGEKIIMKCCDNKPHTIVKIMKWNDGEYAYLLENGYSFTPEYMENNRDKFGFEVINKI